MYLNKSERGFSIFWVTVIIFFSIAIATIIAKDLRNLALVEKGIERTTTDTIANTYEVNESTTVAIGDNIYQITPNVIIEEDIYPSKEILEFSKDMDRLTITMGTRYNQVNYMILDGNKILDYRLDPKTEFVGFKLGEVDTSNPLTKSVTVPNYEYPNTQTLIPFTAKHTRNRLSFNVLNGVYMLKYPQVYKTSNDLSELSDTTTLAIKLPDDFTDIILFHSDMLHPAPIVLRDDYTEVTDYLTTIPHIRISYSEIDSKLTISTNLVSIENESLNGKVIQNGVTVSMDMHQANAYEIISQGNRLNYPTQNKFKYQIHDEVEQSNWNYSKNSFSIDFVGCIPQTFTIDRKGYFFTKTTENTVKYQ